MILNSILFIGHSITIRNNTILYLIIQYTIHHNTQYTIHNTIGYELSGQTKRRNEESRTKQQQATKKQATTKQQQQNNIDSFVP